MDLFCFVVELDDLCEALGRMRGAHMDVLKNELLDPFKVRIMQGRVNI